MASLFPNDIEDRSEGELFLENFTDSIKVYFKPPQNRSIELDEFHSETSDERWHILDIDVNGTWLTMYPLKLYDLSDVEDKYDLLKRITVNGFQQSDVKTAGDVIEIVEKLPKIFVHDYRYGLGFKKEYNCIIDKLEELGVSTLIVSRKGQTSFDEENAVFIINNAELDEIRKAVNRNNASARTVARFIQPQSVYNHLAFYLKNEEKYPQRGISINPNLISKLVQQTVAELALDETKTAIETVKRNGKRIANERPQEIIKLRNDLELISLEQLINKYEELLSKKQLEKCWQQLFDDNPFILSLTFGYPFIKVNGQASVGGRKITGKGEKITDFLVKNSISNNAALFEIKTPSTKLLKKSTYRDGVLAPSAELAAAVNQLLDQIHQFQKSAIYVKDASRITTLESYSVHGILIIGRSLAEEVEHKSFELYRGNSKNVTILTFDEVLEKLKQLCKFLSASDNTGEHRTTDENLPF